MNKKLLIIYENMMVGGTTTALVGLLNKLEGIADVDLIFFSNPGKRACDIPKFVNIIEPSCKINNRLVLKVLKIFLTIMNGSFIKWIFCCFKYRKDKNINKRILLSYFSSKAQMQLSRSIKESYDVAIGFMELWADFYLVSNKIKAGKKIGWIHTEYKKAGFVREFDYKIFFKLDNIVTVCESNKKSLESIFPEFKDKIVSIRNFNDSRKILDKSKEYIPFLKEKKIYFATVCRIDFYHKGLDRALKVFDRIVNKDHLNNFKWIIVGNGQDAEKMKKLIKLYNLTEYIEMVGERLNPYPFIRYCDIFFLPSIYEGCPMVVDEALLLNKFCFITKYDSANEQIINNINGILVENDSDSIYKGLKKILLNPLWLSTASYLFKVDDIEAGSLKKLCELIGI